ncbi:hypothetical protein KIPB_007385 [Kipferlia bialata]|uniref:Uncharacterized protein n=1 Tax=Kipferlia bialata TaxID=797122 RepID=A0A9K3GKK0_9EUKA|nr:hypothetical protein KIPB_007385 [Kipferlia bialata]|eukprot:g7385.t1
MRTRLLSNLCSGHVDESGRPVLYLLDDNMTHRSMRRQYVQLAREAGAGLGCLHLTGSLSQSHMGNEGRGSDERVSQCVLSNVSSSMQVPGKRDGVSTHRVLEVPSPVPGSFSTETLDRVSHFCQTVCLDPVPPIEPPRPTDTLTPTQTERQREGESLEANSRKGVSLYLGSEGVKGMSKREKGVVAREANTLRREMVARVKLAQHSVTGSELCVTSTAEHWAAALSAHFDKQS